MGFGGSENDLAFANILMVDSNFSKEFGVHKGIFLLFFILAGCATAPQDSLPFSEVAIPEPNQNESVLVFYRLYTPPLANNMRVSIDDEQIAVLPNNSFSYVMLKPGEYQLKTSWSAWAMVPSRRRDFEIKPQQTLYIQLKSSVYTTAGFMIGSSQHVDQDKLSAEQDLIKRCKFIEPENQVKQEQ